MCQFLVVGMITRSLLIVKKLILFANLKNAVPGEKTSELEMHVFTRCENPLQIVATL
jgi:hypothetical protein